MSADTPLTCVVEGDELVIRIGVATLAFAFEEGQNNPCGENSNAWRATLKVADPAQFASDVVREIKDEAEDGTTPLHEFLGKMCLSAMDQGSLGIEEVESE